MGLPRSPQAAVLNGLTGMDQSLRMARAADSVDKSKGGLGSVTGQEVTRAEFVPSAPHQGIETGRDVLVGAGGQFVPSAPHQGIETTTGR